MPNVLRIIGARLKKIAQTRIRFPVIMVLLLLLGYSFLEPFWIEEKKIIFPSADIPAAFDGYKIVFVSDIHHGPFFSLDRVTSLVDRINAQNPDLVLLGGDYVHRDARYIKPCFEELARITATDGVFGVLGNHDHWEDAELTRSEMKKAGIVDLDNNAVWITKNDDKIKVGGIGDFFEDKQIIDPTIKDVGKKDFALLLSHNPDPVETLPPNIIDLVLSGHTHGGQVSFFGLWAPLIPSLYGQKYRTGIVKTDATTVIISNGIGTITPPARFFTRPQMITVELYKSAE